MKAAATPTPAVVQAAPIDLVSSPSVRGAQSRRGAAADTDDSDNADVVDESPVPPQRQAPKGKPTASAGKAGGGLGAPPGSAAAGKKPPPAPMIRLVPAERLSEQQRNILRDMKLHVRKSPAAVCAGAHVGERHNGGRRQSQPAHPGGRPGAVGALHVHAHRAFAAAAGCVLADTLAPRA